MDRQFQIINSPKPDDRGQSIPAAPRRIGGWQCLELVLLGLMILTRQPSVPSCGLQTFVEEPVPIPAEKLLSSFERCVSR